MFSTFTGNSRRPRNVNLSGQTGNPFANTSWNPSQVSTATKTVSGAQADREKRQAERQRLKAASNIQRVWRGHNTRQSIYERRRDAFDQIYAQHDIRPGQRPALCSQLILSFFSAKRPDDLARVALFAEDAEHMLRDSDEHSSWLILEGSERPDPRLGRLLEILVTTLGALAHDRSSFHALDEADHTANILLRLSSFKLKKIVFLIRHVSRSASDLHSLPLNQYYSALANLAQSQDPEDSWLYLIIGALEDSLRVSSPSDDGVYSSWNVKSVTHQVLVRNASYQSLAFSFLTKKSIHIFESNVEFFARIIHMNLLSRAILAGYHDANDPAATKDDLLQLSAHYIAISRASSASRDTLYLDTLFTQLSALSSELQLRLEIKPTETAADNATDQIAPIDAYAAAQFSLLVDYDGISDLLQDFSRILTTSSDQQARGASVLAGYITTLLQTFKSSADETRMRLFLEQVSTSTGKIPLIKLLWQTMRQSSVFKKLKSESQKPVGLIRDYLRKSSLPSQSSPEHQEWLVILLFLETYNFVLLLSDDEDFFSGIEPQLIQNAQPSRLRTCNLSLPDVQALTAFLKNTAFALHYNAEAILKDLRYDGLTRAIDYELCESNRAHTALQNTFPGKAGFDSLRSIATTTLKMLYDRDSRKKFLPVDHWLMTNKLDQQGFISAVITEEERQIEEAEKVSDDEEEEEDFMSNESASSRLRPSAFSHQVVRHMNMERLRAQQQRAQKERRMAELGPKLEILKHMPFVVPFETRVSIFRRFIALDASRRQGDIFSDMMLPRHTAKVRRESLFEDAFSEFYKLGDGIKDHIHIMFVDRFGAEEAGIDGGGVTKEFLTSVTTEAFKGRGDNKEWFVSNEKGLLYPSPTAMDRAYEALRAHGVDESSPDWRGSIIDMSKRYEFLGRIIGKCMYEGILVDLVFAGFFLLKWPSTGPNNENGYKGSINDLRDMDEDLYRGLLHLKNYPGDVSELGFVFTIDDPVSEPGQPLKTVTRNLIPNGDKISVNNDNRPLYVSYAARHRLVSQPLFQTRAFLQGLRAVIRPSWLSMFNQTELQRLIGGDSTEIDIEDLRDNTVYSGLYAIGDDKEEHPTIKLFWKVVSQFSDAERRYLLKYVSSTPRAPLLGFSQLRPKFSIRDSGSDESRLPSTSTCVNLLKLPRYTTEATLREKLLYAITSGAGFDLS